MASQRACLYCEDSLPRYRSLFSRGDSIPSELSGLSYSSGTPTLKPLFSLVGKLHPSLPHGPAAGLHPTPGQDLAGLDSELFEGRGCLEQKVAPDRC